MENRGGRVAKDVYGSLKIVEVQTEERQTVFETSFSISNEVPPNSPTPWYNDSVVFPRNHPPCAILLVLKYRDPILNKAYVQLFTMKWAGVVDGVTHPDFVYSSIEQAADYAPILQRFSGLISDKDMKRLLPPKVEDS
jgi:hypothetical protein